MHRIPTPVTTEQDHRYMSAEGMAPDKGEELDPRRDAVRVGTTVGRDNRFLGYCVKDMSQESSALR